MSDSPKLSWEWGTAYDMFISLEVLHEPAEFGVRGSWAASIRKRIPAAEREILAIGRKIFHIPFHWLHTLPSPKDGITVLYSLSQIPPDQLLDRLVLCKEMENAAEIIDGIITKGSVDDRDIEAYIEASGMEGQRTAASHKKLTSYLQNWTRAAELPERYPAAMQTYHELFFSEEEKRIRPALKEAYTRGQALAEKLPLKDLVEDLSQGLRFTETLDLDELVLAPSFWVTPLMLFGDLGTRKSIWMFGARRLDQSLIPGETVPEGLLRALKALSDPTRLKILHYLAQESLSPAELARRLRLRAPTVTHHLQILRLAGLVQVTIGEGKEKKSFAARTETVKSTCATLEAFLGKIESTD